MANSIMFFNFSDKEFTHRWDGTAYTFAPFQKVYIEDFKADHFAKHLVDRELQRCNKRIDSPERAELVSKCLISVADPIPDQPIIREKEEVREDEAKEEILEEPKEEVAEEPKQGGKKRFCDKCDSKGGIHKKGCPNRKEKKSEEFPDLNK